MRKAIRIIDLNQALTGLEARLTIRKVEANTLFELF